MSIPVKASARTIPGLPRGACLVSGTLAEAKEARNPLRRLLRDTSVDLEQAFRDTIKAEVG